MPIQRKVLYYVKHSQSAIFECTTDQMMVFMLLRLYLRRKILQEKQASHKSTESTKMTLHTHDPMQKFS